MSMKGREVRRSEGGSRWMAIRGKRSMQADEFIAVREERRKAACHPRIGCSSLVQGKKGEKPPHLFFFFLTPSRISPFHPAPPKRFHILRMPRSHFLYTNCTDGAAVGELA